MSAIVVLNESEIEGIDGGRMGFFQTIGWAFDNPGEAAGIVADRFYNWYKLTPNEDPNWFID